mmetsp:Transcript_39133/g.101149  ORF Transcript_39133/g.101149 Transcript_39133/m.101149 type:complete len:662 (-) Transcript_39133:25-2010(-)
MSELDIADIFADEGNAGDVLKSLISLDPLQVAWSKIGGRLQNLEHLMHHVQATLDRLPKEYVARAEYRELVEIKHTRMLADHSKVLGRVEEMALRLQNSVDDEHSPQIKSCLARLQVQEDWQAKVQEVVSGVEQRTEQLQVTVTEKLQRSTDEVSQAVAKADGQLEHLQRVVLEKLEGIGPELKALEARCGEDAEKQISRATAELLKWGGDNDDEEEEEEGEGTGGESKQKLSPQQKMAQFLEKGTDPLRADLAKAQAQLVELGDRLAAQSSKLTLQIRSSEKSSLDGHVQLRQSIEELAEELKLAAKHAALQKVEGTLAGAIQDSANKHETLEKTLVMKLNMFLDHCGKLQEAMDDHEHCLTHHAEELENRGTKYDVLICQKQIDRCTRKEEFNRELAEIKKVLNWQSEKIGSFGLMSMGGGPQPAKKDSRKSLRHSLRSSSGSDISVKSGDAPDGEVGPLGIRRRSMLQGSKSPRSLGGVIDDSQLEDVQEESSEDEADSDEEEDTNQFSNSAVLRKQLEAVSMGLLGLAHLVLLQPKIGASRNARLVQEKALLDEIGSLRHWITNRSAPGGWDPSKITTVALRCTHMPLDEVPRPLPQLSLKGILHGHDGPPYTSRLSALQASGVLSKDPSLTRMPHSARGADAKSATAPLPPLQGAS